MTVDFAANSLEQVQAVNVLSLIKQAEKVREEGNSTLAAHMLGIALQDAERLGRDELIGETLGQLIVCLKHLYQNGDKSSLASMEQMVARGLVLKISDQSKAVFLLRQGDVYTFKKEYKPAEASYNAALRLVLKTNGYLAIEYKGHWAESLLKIGRDSKYVSRLIEDAINDLAKVTDVREFHRLIILSGLYARLAKSQKQSWQFIRAYRSLRKCYQLCKQLRNQYNMPQRLNQFYQNLPGGQFWFGLLGSI